MLFCSGDSMKHLQMPNGEVSSIPARRTSREATTRTEPRPAGREGEALRELKLTCMNNLLSATEERVYFKDLRSRFLLVSKGWTAAYAPGRAEEELIGETDFDVFDEQHASVAFADEQQIIRTGRAIAGKVQRETFSGRAATWASTTKMPLRDERGKIIGTFGISRDITAQIEAENALARQALHDPLTGLANRIALMDRLSQAMLAMARHPSRVGVVFIDLDNFKGINDCFGHDAGDLVLAEVGRRLSALARRTDTVARLGGDEFVILCGELGNDTDVHLIGDRIIRAIAVPYLDSGRDLSVTCSVGIVVDSDPGAEPDRLIRDADTAMYEAKRAGRNRYRVYNPAHRTCGDRSLLHSDLCRAIEDSELFLVYQPTFSLERQLLTGVEALVRWRHRERGIILPDEFIPFAEDHGLIERIGSFVLDEACRQLAEWTSRDDWPGAFTMAVNVSGRELSDPRFSGRVAEVIRRHGIDPSRLCLEITETALSGEAGDAQETLAALAAIGVRIALDDFGTGYSTLAHLQWLNVDVLKIDRMFVAQVGRSPRDREIVAAVTAMCHALGMTVVGEGIETSCQLKTLTAMHCEEGQGFLFARPLPPEAIVTLAGAGHRAGPAADQDVC
jgi:diguanylate cyclase (GGDEF)-like protein/PAS domain S-box-containing protein